MWFWCNVPFSALWWLFPLAMIICMVMMFLMMRAFFTGRFPCRTMRLRGKGHDNSACGGGGIGGGKTQITEED